MEDNNTYVENVEYTRPKFWHRVMANLVDVVIFFLLFVIFFAISRSVVESTSYYQRIDADVRQTRLDSGLYVDTGDVDLVDVITYAESLVVYGSDYNVPYDSYTEPATKLGYISKSINTFEHFLETNVPIRLDEFKAYKTQYFLEKEYEGVKFFNLNEGALEPNPTLWDDAKNRKYYYDRLYAPFVDDYCFGFFTVNAPRYAENMKMYSNFLFFVEIPISYTISIVLVWFVPPIFFKKGRQTLGKAMYHIGSVDKRLLSPTFGKFALRFLLLFFMEMILSLVSFGIPFIISFSMMAFSKNRQSFPDYIFGWYEVDVSKAKIYMDYVEAELDKKPSYKKPVDFSLPKDL